MLLHHDSLKPLYVLGTGVSSQKLKNYIRYDTDGTVMCLDHTEFQELQDNDQCIAGFYNYRENVNYLITNKKLSWVTYIHQDAFVDPTSSIGPGSVILPLAFIDYMSCIGNCCTLSPGSMIGHNARLGNNGVLCPKTHIGGSTNIGNNFWLGQSATVSDKLTIVDNVTCVIGSIVTKNILTPGRYNNNKKITTV